MAKPKISSKITKRHLIALLEERVEQLERRVEDLEHACKPMWYVYPYAPPYGTDKTRPPYEITITSVGGPSRT